MLDQKIKEAHAKFGPQSFPLDNEKELQIMFSEIRALKRPHQLLEVIFKALIVELNGPDWASCTWQDLQKELADPRSVLACMR